MGHSEDLPADVTQVARDSVGLKPFVAARPAACPVVVACLCVH